MTLIDSIDSILMLYSYSGFSERGFALFDGKPSVASGMDNNNLVSQNLPTSVDSPALASLHSVKAPSPIAGIGELSARPCPGVAPDSSSTKSPNPQAYDEEGIINITGGPVEDVEMQRLRHVKRNAMSSLSILLTLMSILVAFR